MMELTGRAVALSGDRILCMEELDAEGDGPVKKEGHNRQTAP